MKCPECGHTFKPHKERYLDYVFLSPEEYGKLVKRFGEQGTNDRIKNLDDAIAIHGYKYKDHYRVILKWEETNDNRQGTGKTSQAQSGSSKGGKTNVKGKRSSRFHGLDEKDYTEGAINQ